MVSKRFGFKAGIIAMTAVIVAGGVAATQTV